MRKIDAPGVPEIRRRRLAELLFGLACFLVLSCFFISAHPIVVLDSDDWQYIHVFRSPFPDPEEWNPARILPELLMPFVSMLSVRFVGTVTGADPILAMSWGFAVAVSAFFGLYCAAFLRFVHSRLEIGGWKALCMGALFVIFHFVMFRSKTEHNPCLLFSIDATCYFYYTIPALLNGAVILLLLADDITEDFFAGNRIGAKAVFLAAAYFCVFSNLFESVMLAVFCGVRILFSLLKKEKRTFLSLLRENCIRGLVVLAWLISMVYEARGPRAKSLALSEPLSAAAVKSFKNMIARALQCNRAAAVFIAAVLVTAAILLLIRYRKEPLKKRTLAAEVVVNGVLVGIFIVLLCARVGPIRSSRMDVLLSCTFYAFVFLAAAGAYILKTREKSALLLPLLVFILFFECNTRSTTFRESNLFGWTPEQCFAISRDIVSQLQEADRAGAQEIVLRVPKRNGVDNWPFAYFGEDRYSAALYKLGVISRDIPTTIQPSEEYNRSFGLPDG